MKHSRRNFISSSSLLVLGGVFGKSVAGEVIHQSVSFQRLNLVQIPLEIMPLCATHEITFSNLGFTRSDSGILFSDSKMNLIVPYFQKVGKKNINGHYLLFSKDTDWKYVGQLNEYEWKGIKHLLYKSQDPVSYFPYTIEIKEGKKQFLSENGEYRICTRLMDEEIRIELEVTGQRITLRG